jgi:hypothetical protein
MRIRKYISSFGRLLQEMLGLKKKERNISPVFSWID